MRRRNRSIAVLAAFALTLALVGLGAAAAEASVTAPADHAILRGDATLTESGSTSSWECSHGNSYIQLIDSGNHVVYSHHRNDDGKNSVTIDTHHYRNGTYTVHGIRSDHVWEWHGFHSGCKWHTHTSDRTVTIDNYTSIKYTGATSAPQKTSVQVSATLTDPHKSPRAVSGKRVTFHLSGGATVSDTTNSQGVATATLPISGPPRSATVTAEFVKDPYYRGDKASAGFTVTKDATKTTMKAPAEVVHGQATRFTAQVTATQGTGTPDGSVQFTVDGHDFGNPVALVGGSATSAPTSNLSTGDHVVGARFLGSDGYRASTAADTVTQTVTKAKTTTSLATDHNPSVRGQKVTFNATVDVVAPGAGTPTGGVQFDVDGQPYGTAVPLDGDTASIAISGLHAGNHDVKATYNGDGDFASSTSPAVTQGVNRAETALTLRGPDTTPVSGQPLTFTAEVVAVGPGGGTPGGTVQFYADGNEIGGPVTLSSGSATSPRVELDAGTHEITADYAGSPDYAGSSSSVDQDVSAAATTATVSLESNPSVFGQPVKVHVVVSPVSPATGTPTGSVQLLVDGSASGLPATLHDGAADASLTGLAPGSHEVTATYVSSDPDFLGSTSDPQTQQVNKAATRTSVQSSAPTSVFGQPVTITATVQVVAPGAGSPAGTVTFKDGDRVLGTEPVGPGTDERASIVVSDLSVAQHAIVAGYSGGDDFLGSSGSTTQVVQRAQSSTVVTSSANPAKSGEAVQFTAKVSPVAPGAGEPTGTVRFTVNGAELGDPVAVVDGVATSPTFASLSPGTYRIEASYSGDGHFVGSTGSLDQGNGQDVTQAATTVGLTSSPDPAAYGAPVTFTTTVAAVAPATGNPSGVVQVWEGGQLLGATSLAPAGEDRSQATFVSSTLSPGAHEIRAVYVGNFNFEGNSASASQTIGEVPTVTGVSASPNPATFGDSVELTAVVRKGAPAAGRPTGTVTFREGSAVLGTAPVADVDGTEQAAITVPGLDAGTHSVTATYSGDDTFASSSSTSYDVEVQRAPSRLVAETMFAQIGDNAGQARATLTGNDGAPLAGQTLVFTTTQRTDHGVIHICDAVTDENGFASCDATTLVPAIYLDDGYDVRFAGNADYLPSEGHGTYVTEAR